MSLPNKRWIISSPLLAEEEANLQPFSPVLRQILHNRGYKTLETAHRYLEALPPPGTEASYLLGVPESVSRILSAIQKEEAIAVYGDYDADGVTATALLYLALVALGANVRGYIPNRFDEGYGLNVDALDTLHEEGIGLVVTVDCGIRSPEEAEHALHLGLDLIITDHHQPSHQMPHAYAVINPKQPGDSYPDKNLAGVGLAYKLACALYDQLETEGRLLRTIPPITDFLDLVALGTVADLAPLVGENRALVRAGLEHIRRPHRQGLMSLIGVSGLAPNRIDASNISFALGPRLNAAGRLDSALAALDLLTTQEVNQAGYLAQLLNSQNRERQELTREIQVHAEQLALAEDPEASLLFAADESFNPGVVGLAASRLTEQYYRPAIVAQRGEQFTRGSCRSIPEFHITKALDECADILVHHGGHAAAAGFTLQTQDLPELEFRLKAIAQRELGSLTLRPTISADLEIPLSELKPEILHDLEKLQPTGQDNPPASFVTRELKVVRSRTVGKDNAHLKLSVTDGRLTYDAIAFRQGHWIDQMPPRIDMLYQFEVNEYNGRLGLQLNVRDLKPAGLTD